MPKKALSESPENPILDLSIFGGDIVSGNEAVSGLQSSTSMRLEFDGGVISLASLIFSLTS